MLLMSPNKHITSLKGTENTDGNQGKIASGFAFCWCVTSLFQEGHGCSSCICDAPAFGSTAVTQITNDVHLLYVNKYFLLI